MDERHKRWLRKPRIESQPVYVVVEPTPVEAAPAIHFEPKIEPKVEQSRSMIRATWIMAGTSILMFVVAVATAITSFHQWRVMSQQLTQMERDHGAAKDQSKATIDEMAKDRKLVEDQLKQNEKVLDQMRLEQRAWVSVTAPRLFLDVGKPLRWEMTYHNSGQTPALIERVLWQVALRPASDVLDPATVKLSSADVQQRSLAPEQHRDGDFILANVIVTQELHDRMTGVAPPVRAYVMGRIEYKDVANQSRATEFCLIYEPKPDQPNLLRFYSKHNRML